MKDFFRNLLGKGKIPRRVEEMISHQAKGTQNHPTYGKIEPYGISGWKTEHLYEIPINGVSYRVSARFLISDSKDRKQEENFRRLEASVPQIFENFLGYQNLEDDEEPETPEDQCGHFELSVRSQDYSSEFQWVGEGESGNTGEVFHLFFEGLNLRGAVPDWDDPASGGFEEWDW